MPKGTCSVEGCERNTQKRGLCDAHYRAMLKSGALARVRAVPSRDLAERFWEKVDRTGDCWLWTAAKFHHDYGMFVIGGNNRLAHRVAYELLVGPIPEGLVLDHLCGNPPCVNPAHLEPVTQAENMHRIAGRKTHCPRGHEYTPENSYVYNNRVFCRACRRKPFRR